MPILVSMSYIIGLLIQVRVFAVGGAGSCQPQGLRGQRWKWGRETYPTKSSLCIFLYLWVFGDFSVSHSHMIIFLILQTSGVSVFRLLCQTRPDSYFLASEGLIEKNKSFLVCMLPLSFLLKPPV